MGLGLRGSYCLIYGIVLVLALFFMCSLFFFFFFYDEVYFKVVGSRHPGAPRKAQGSLRRQTRRLLPEFFFFFAK